MEEQKNHSNLKRIKKYSYGIVFFVIIVMTILAVTTSRGFPSQLRMLSIESSSMEPNVKKGSMVFVRPQANYAIDSIITFTNRLSPNDPQEYTITHRLVNVIENDAGTFYETKGDANDIVDQVPVSKDKVIGEVVFSLPFLGSAVDFIQTPIGFLLLIALPSFLLIINESYIIKEEIENLLERRRKKDSDRKPNLAIPLIIILFSLMALPTYNSIAAFTESEEIDNNQITTGNWERGTIETQPIAETQDRIYQPTREPDKNQPIVEPKQQSSEPSIEEIQFIPGPNTVSSNDNTTVSTSINIPAENTSEETIITESD